MPRHSILLEVAENFSFTDRKHKRNMRIGEIDDILKTELKCFMITFSFIFRVFKFPFRFSLRLFVQPIQFQTKLIVNSRTICLVSVPMLGEFEWQCLALKDLSMKT